MIAISLQMTKCDIITCSSLIALKNYPIGEVNTVNKTTVNGFYSEIKIIAESFFEAELEIVPCVIAELRECKFAERNGKLLSTADFKSEDVKKSIELSLESFLVVCKHKVAVKYSPQFFRTPIGIATLIIIVCLVILSAALALAVYLKNKD